MITALTWIRKGLPSAKPLQYNLTDAEYEELSKKFGEELKIAKDDYERVMEESSSEFETDDECVNEGDEDNGDNGDMEVDDNQHEEKATSASKTKTESQSQSQSQDKTQDLSEYNLDDYDNEETGQSMSLFSSIGGLTYYTSPNEDPYLTLPQNEDSDQEDLTINPTDNLLIIAKTEDDLSHLEVNLYEGEQGEDNVYVHHDLLVSSVPICMESVEAKLDQNSDSCNYLAIGTLNPAVEIYPLDIIDCLMPTITLGAPSTQKLPRKSTQYHISSVLALSHNKSSPNFLVSGSADKTIKLWDLNGSHTSSVRSFAVHRDKVSAVKIHPTEREVLLSGGYDKQVLVMDMRSPDSKLSAKVSADVECVTWFNDVTFLVGVDNGMIMKYDSRSLPKPIWTLQSASSLSSLSLSPTQTLLATGSSDDNITKVWSLDPKPSLLLSKDLGVGKPFAMEWCPDEDGVLGVGGSQGKMVVWNVAASVAKKMGKGKNDKRKEVAAIVSDQEEESEEDVDR